MITIKYTPLAVLLGLTLAAGSANASLYVYEGFQYSNVGDGLHGEPNGAGTPADVDATGLGGVWNDQLSTANQLDIYSGSLAFGNLTTAGNSVGSSTTTGEDIYSRSMTDSNIGTADDLFFSILIQPNDSNGASQAGLVLSDATIGGSNGRFDNITVANGIGVGSQGSANFKPFVWAEGTQTTSTGSLSTSDGSTYMLIGHLSFGTGTAGADEFSLYNYNLVTSGGVVTADFANLDLIGETLEVNLTESDIDTLSLTRQRRPTYDEIRVGSSLDDVLGLTAVPEPSSTALIGLGGLALILRRRK
jgi:hypothetical protein